jgi:hypothetical protein
MHVCLVYANLQFVLNVYLGSKYMCVRHLIIKFTPLLQLHFYCVHKSSCKFQ